MSKTTQFRVLLPTDCNAYNRKNVSDERFAGRAFSSRVVVGLDDQSRSIEFRKEEIKRRAREQISKIAEDAANKIRALVNKGVKA